MKNRCTLISLLFSLFLFGGCSFATILNEKLDFKAPADYRYVTVYADNETGEKFRYDLDRGFEYGKSELSFAAMLENEKFLEWVLGLKNGNYSILGLSTTDYFTYEEYIWPDYGNYQHVKRIIKTPESGKLFSPEKNFTLADTRSEIHLFWNSPLKKILIHGNDLDDSVFELELPDPVSYGDSIQISYSELCENESFRNWKNRLSKRDRNYQMIRGFTSSPVAGDFYSTFTVSREVSEVYLSWGYGFTVRIYANNGTGSYYDVSVNSGSSSGYLYLEDLANDIGFYNWAMSLYNENKSVIGFSKTPNGPLYTSDSIYINNGESLYLRWESIVDSFRVYKSSDSDEYFTYSFSSPISSGNSRSFWLNNMLTENPSFANWYFSLVPSDMNKWHIAGFEERNTGSSYVNSFATVNENHTEYNLVWAENSNNHYLRIYTNNGTDDYNIVNIGSSMNDYGNSVIQVDWSRLFGINGVYSGVSNGDLSLTGISDSPYGLPVCTPSGGTLQVSGTQNTFWFCWGEGQLPESGTLYIPGPTTLKIGERRELRLETIGGSPLYSVSYSSTDTSVATVDGMGFVRGAGEGTAEILATISAGSRSVTYTTPVLVSSHPFNRVLEDRDLKRIKSISASRFNDVVGTYTGSYNQKGMFFRERDGEWIYTNMYSPDFACISSEGNLMAASYEDSSKVLLSSGVGELVTEIDLSLFTGRNISGTYCLSMNQDGTRIYIMAKDASNSDSPVLVLIKIESGEMFCSVIESCEVTGIPEKIGTDSTGNTIIVQCGDCVWASLDGGNFWSVSDASVVTSDIDNYGNIYVLMKMTETYSAIVKISLNEEEPVIILQDEGITDFSVSPEGHYITVFQSGELIYSQLSTLNGPVWESKKLHLAGDHVLETGENYIFAGENRKDGAEAAYLFYW